ncbi:uncharacterized protein N7500_006236 [Penicillium coprophilum]|uniref:uncharacterized protein n=1 Tax=Penicillium coprophilum TaxID=36646 RepID=UPI00239DED89|nr:uncharacterized protein N7500_006236 [Penicillium coprophilum]KAJ5164406.1 hypothetical protein N7500_006236 [Penicillium coprophilum]
MGIESSLNQQTTAVNGGSSAQPTPANSDDGSGWGDRLWLGGKNEGLGHADAPNPKSTMGGFLALDEQKTRGESKLSERQNLVDFEKTSVRPINAEGEPTCASEDHSFMKHKAGDPDTYPGWSTVKNIFGR